MTMQVLVTAVRDDKGATWLFEMPRKATLSFGVSLWSLTSTEGRNLRIVRQTVDHFLLDHHLNIAQTVLS